MKFFTSLLLVVFCVLWSFGQEHQKPHLNNSNQNNTLQNNSNNSLEEIEIKKEAPTVKKTQELQKTTQKKSAEKEQQQRSKAPAVSGNASQNQAVQKTFTVQRKMASTQTTSRSPSSVQQEEMNKAVDFYKQHAPESFEFHYFTYTAGNYDISLFPHLQKAQQLKPANSDVIIQLAAYYAITKNSQQAKANLEKLVQNGRIGSDVLGYDKDLLNSVSQGGVLLTHGFDDTYGVLYQQLNKSIRSDVRIISLDFMQSKAYRDSLGKEGFVLPASKVIDTYFLEQFCKLNKAKQVHVSMTFPKPYLASVVNKLKVTGISFLYHEGQYPAFEKNEGLWATYTSAGFIEKATTEKAKQLSSNYLPMLFLLRERYSERGQKKDLERIDKHIDRIGAQSNKLSTVNSMRGKN